MIVSLLYVVAAALLVGASALIFRELLIAVGPDNPAQRSVRRPSSRPDSAVPRLRRAA